MNIFFLSLIPTICAEQHVDKHVVKMILETAQLLSSVHYVSGSSYVPKYKLTHKNHPCAIWSRTSLTNYKWLCELGIALCKEYTYRYGKIHKSEEVIVDLQNNLPLIQDIGFTEPAQAMPDTYKDKDPIEAYRSYYFFEKHKIHSWKKRNIPEWIINIHNAFE